MNENPIVIGRKDDMQLIDERSETGKGPSITIPYQSGACGVLTAEIFISKQHEDRGGIVLRVTNKDVGGSFEPFCKKIENGIEIHMAGEVESEVFILAVKGLFDTLLSANDKFHPSL